MIMVDLNPLQQYIINPCPEHYIETFKRNYLAYGFDRCFDNEINSFLNCEKTLNGHRIIQTNDHRYNVEVTNTIWLIENAFKEDEDKDNYFKILLERHNKNIEFERINGFEYDPNSKDKKNKIKTVRTKTKSSNISDTPKEKKETAAERKLKAHAAKINALKFKPKSVNNGNII